jgi:uncharacterized protein YggU (UPF0235/DUF167 family)
VAAAPIDGKANRELVRFLSEMLGVPRGNIAVRKGEAGRQKTVAVLGVAAERAGRLLGLAGPD